jgi:hypothetical protein
VVLLFFILSHKVVSLLPEHAEANITSHLYAMLIDCCIMELLKHSRKYVYQYLFFSINYNLNTIPETVDVSHE